MKLFYITTMERMQEVQRSWHSLVLPSGKLFVCVEWQNDKEEFDWASKADVLALPHPIFESTQALTEEHISHLGPRLGLQSGNNVHHAIKSAAKEDFWMRLHVL